MGCAQTSEKTVIIKSEWAIDASNYNKSTATPIDIHSWKNRCNMETMVAPSLQFLLWKLKHSTQTSVDNSSKPHNNN